MKKLDKEDVVKNIFAGKYTLSEIINALSDLEIDKEIQRQLFKKYHPSWYNDNLGGSLHSISLCKRLGIFNEKDRTKKIVVTNTVF